ncbi:hypothetical protein SATMO3_10420 [Sporomusa aerivorans]
MKGKSLRRYCEVRGTHDCASQGDQERHASYNTAELAAKKDNNQHCI